MTISAPTKKAYKKAYIPSFAEDSFLLKHILCIYYLLCFKKNQAKIQALLNFNTEINTMTPAYMANLGLKIRPTNVRAQKIDGSIFNPFGMALASLKVNDNCN